MGGFAVAILFDDQFALASVIAYLDIPTLLKFQGDGYDASGAMELFPSKVLDADPSLTLHTESKNLAVCTKPQSICVSKSKTYIDSHSKLEIEDDIND